MKDVIGPHRARVLSEDFSASLDFTVAGVQQLDDVTQNSNIQFTRGSMNTDDEVFNTIYVKVDASGSHTLTFSSAFVEFRNDFAGAAGTFHIMFMCLPDSKVGYVIAEET